MEGYASSNILGDDMTLASIDLQQKSRDISNAHQMKAWFTSATVRKFFCNKKQLC